MTATNRWMSELDFAKTQLVTLLVILLLAVDALNPVKLFLHVFGGNDNSLFPHFTLAPWHVATLCLLLMTYVFLNNMKELLYFSVKVFFHSILSIFFNRVEAVGLDNVPPYGPVIFTSNHANQFIDGVLIMCTCRRKISYLVAEKSWNRRIIGDIAWAMGAVPVRRAQDSARRGTGVVSLRGMTMAVAVKEEEAQGAEAVAKKNEGDNSSDNNAGPPHVEFKNDTDQDDQDAKSASSAAGTAPPPPPAAVLIEVHGTGTKFKSELGKNDKLRLAGADASPLLLKVVDIVSDTLLHVERPPDFDDAALLDSTSSTSSEGEGEGEGKGGDGKAEGTTYDTLKHIDQHVVYEKVLDELGGGGTIGIFPEGGSHDRTDLLPLKVGVSLIAYSALEKDGAAVPIVPVGLNYFRAHRFRGRAIVEFGRPTYADPETLSAYKQGGLPKRKACSGLLERIEDSMRSVIVSTPDYDVLRLIYVARRLYQRKEYSTSEKQDMTRRFAEGYKRLMQRGGGSLSADKASLQSRLLAYSDELHELGMRDYQVLELDRERHEYEADRAMRENRVLYHVAHLVVVLVLAAVPAIALNLPVGLLARLYSQQKRKKALAASKVKIKGLDVVLSEKVLFCIVAVPTLWLTYGLALALLTDLDAQTVALAIATMPAFSYAGVVAAEAGVADWRKDLRPYLMRLFPGARRRMAALPDVRRSLQRDVRDFVEKVGPTMADLYYEEEVDWKGVIEDTRRASHAGLVSMGAGAMATATTTSGDDGGGAGEGEATAAAEEVVKKEQ